MQYLIIFFVELFLLFLLSRTLTRTISLFMHSVTKSKNITIVSVAFLFFPGTVIHELSHYVTAKLLFVQTYGMNLFPKLDGENLKLGSVSIAKTDFFRRLLIGMAPFFIGTIIVIGTLYYAVHAHLFDKALYVALITYVVFEIGNTMFSSKKDMEGALEVLLSLVIISGAVYFTGIHFSFFDPTIIFDNQLIRQTFEKGCLFLIVPIAIDFIIIAILRLLLRTKS